MLTQAQQDLWIAIYSEDEDVLKEALKKVAKKDPILNAKNDHGWTPLSQAYHNGNLKMAKVLLEHGANANTPDKNGQTPLIEAFNKGSLEMAKILLEYGASVDKKTSKRLLSLLEEVELGRFINFAEVIDSELISPDAREIIEEEYKRRAEAEVKAENEPPLVNLPNKSSGIQATILITLFAFNKGDVQVIPLDVLWVALKFLGSGRSLSSEGECFTPFVEGPLRYLSPRDENGLRNPRSDERVVGHNTGTLAITRDSLSSFFGQGK